MVNPADDIKKLNANIERPQREQGQKMRPVEKPDADSDFKKVLEEKRKEVARRSQEKGKGKEKVKEEKSAEKSFSIFDLPKKQKKLKALKEKPTLSSNEEKEIDEEPSSSNKPLQKDVTVDEKASDKRFDQTTALKQEASIEISKSFSTQQTQKARTDLVELAKALISKLSVIKADGKTQTLITLNHPPLFKGAQVTLTEYNTAKGEYNLTFTNLTQEAKNLIDLQANQDILKQALAEKGHPVHIMIATTEPELKSTSADSSHFNRDEQESRQEGDREQEQQEKR